MKQLDQRVAKLEKIMAERLPNLSGMSVEQLGRLLVDNIDNPARTDLLYRAMSDQQLDELGVAISEELAARAAKADALPPQQDDHA